MQKCFLHHSLASRRPWGAPADLFLENGGDGKNDNHILVGSKLSVACSESTRCRGLTIFENEAVKAKTRPSFYSKTSRRERPMAADLQIFDVKNILL